MRPWPTSRDSAAFGSSSISIGAAAGGRRSGPRGGPKRGLFATRAPDRPSPLGLTNVALETVDLARGEVHVLGLDLLDETPILDIKPYLPMFDAWPEAGHGWIEPYLEAGIEPKLKRQASGDEIAARSEIVKSPRDPKT